MRVNSVGSDDDDDGRDTALVMLLLLILVLRCNSDLLPGRSESERDRRERVLDGYRSIDMDLLNISVILLLLLLPIILLLLLLLFQAFAFCVVISFFFNTKYYSTNMDCLLPPISQSSLCLLQLLVMLVLSYERMGS